VASDKSMCPGADSDSKSEYKDIHGCKGGRCVRLTTYHLHVPIVKKSGGLNLLEPCGPYRAVMGLLYLCKLFFSDLVFAFSIPNSSPADYRQDMKSWTP